MRELTLLLKPASGQCNARCAYCFYQDVTQKRNQASCGMMTVATLEIILRKALRQAEKGCTIIYQGGEPSLRGLSFYQKPWSCKNSTIGAGFLSVMCFKPMA